MREILLERIPKENILWNAEVEKYRDERWELGGHDNFEKESPSTDERFNRKLCFNCRRGRVALESAKDSTRIVRERSGSRFEVLGRRVNHGIYAFKTLLVEHRGFYAVDGQSRMFTMPFADENKDDNREQKTMWQLSVRCDEREAKRLYGERESTCFDQIIKQFCMENEPLARRANRKMFEKTDFSHAWAGPLYDREEPTKIVDDGIIAVIGDASHPMSPFKGQGANTAIEDAWLLCEWLDGPKAPKSLHTALKCFHRESFAKAFKRVRQSREACEIYHDPVKVFRFCENEITSLTKAQSLNVLPGR